MFLLHGTMYMYVVKTNLNVTFNVGFIVEWGFEDTCSYIPWQHAKFIIVGIHVGLYVFKILCSFTKLSNFLKQDFLVLGNVYVMMKQ